MAASRLRVPAGGKCGCGFQMRFRDVGRFRVERCASASKGGFHVERRSDASMMSSPVALSVWSSGATVSERRFGRSVSSMLSNAL